MLPVLAVSLLLAARPGTVVMVHGAGGGGWEYDFWRPVFAEAGWRVVAKDLQPAKAGLAQTTFDDYVDQVASWCRSARRPLVLVGASMGGPLALKAAEKVRPQAVVLVNAVVPKGIAAPLAQATPFPDVVRWAGGPLADSVAAMPDSDNKTVRKAWKRWRDESGRVMNALRAGIDVAPPRCPTLVVLGSDDTDVPPEGGHKMASAYGADVVELAKTSHVGPLLGRRAAEVARQVLVWVRSRG